MYVNEGDMVTAGKTKLFEVDSIKLNDAVEISKQDYAVAEQGVNVAEAGLDQVNAQLRKAEADLKRLTNLYEKEVVTKDTLEKIQTGYDQLVAGKKQAESGVALAKERRKQAEVALRISRKNLSDATIHAPISGRVSHRFSEIGEMAAPGMPVIRIENTRLLEASAFLPAEYFAQITTGGTKVHLAASGIDLGLRPVSYKSPTINPKLRTFEVKAIINNPPAGVAPGAMVDFSAVIARRTGMGVPSDCIQTRGGKDVLFVADGGRTAMKIVKKGIESEGYVEISGSDLNEGDRVITEGQNFLEDGSPIMIGGEAK